MRRFIFVQDGKVYIEDDHWITINADKEAGQKGQHVYVKENGDIIFGLGGKFKNLRELGGKGNERYVISEDELLDYLNTKEGRVFHGLADKNFSIFKQEDLTKDDITNFNPVKYHEKQPTEREIIENLGGGDNTKGSCASLAIAYAAQKGGMNVLDFRGEPSRSFFADDERTRTMFKDAVIATEERTVGGTMKLLELVQSLPDGKEFLLATGNHMAVICKDAEGWIDYLELQNPDHCGWRSLGNPMTEYGKGEAKDVLRNRFKAQTFFKNGYKKKYWKSSLIDCDKLRENKNFKIALGFINTDKDKQNKSDTGSEK